MSWELAVSVLTLAGSIQFAGWALGKMHLARAGREYAEGLLAEERVRTKDLQNRLDARSLTEYAVAAEYVEHEQPAASPTAGLPKGARLISDETGLIDGYVLDTEET